MILDGDEILIMAKYRVINLFNSVDSVKVAVELISRFERYDKELGLQKVYDIAKVAEKVRETIDKFNKCELIDGDNIVLGQDYIQFDERR